jgi:hypothetical protein
MVVRSRADAVAEATLDARTSSVVRTSGWHMYTRAFVFVARNRLTRSSLAGLRRRGFFIRVFTGLDRRRFAVASRVVLDERETINWLRIHFTQSAHGDIND